MNKMYLDNLKKIDFYNYKVDIDCYIWKKNDGLTNTVKETGVKKANKTNRSIYKQQLQRRR